MQNRQRPVEVRHTGPLRILAFSDYRIHRMEPLLRYVRESSRRPDIILYAGDDVHRFGPVPLDSLVTEPVRTGYPRELEAALVSYAGGRSSAPSVFGYVLRLPKATDTLEAAHARLSEVSDLVQSIRDLRQGTGQLGTEELRDFLHSVRDTLAVQTSTDSILGSRVFVRDTSTKTTLFSFTDNSGALEPTHFDDAYWGLRWNPDEGASPLKVRRFKTDANYAYYHVGEAKRERNVFEELSESSHYGVGAVIGNDDPHGAKVWIRGDRVWELQSTPVRVGPFLISGLEGSTDRMGLSGDYSEADRESRLKSAKRLSGKNGRIIIVSHVPPRGVLDRAMRYGDEAIGSTALREFIDAEDHVPLVVCGHVHRCGGQCQTVGRTVVVNVSSHDDAFTRANMAWITISEVGEVQVEFTKLPSLLEHMLVAEQADEAKLADETRLSPNEARVFLENYRSHGSTLFDHLEGLAHMKFRYGLTWNLTFAAYARGVTQHDEMTDGVFESLGRNTQGFDHIHLRRAYAKFRREKDSGQVYLMEPLPTFPSGRTVIFDTEYVDSEHGVLFGFQDLEGGEVKQFWFDQEDGTIDYLMARQGATFVHWGGADRALLQGLRDGDAKTVNLLYKVQTSLVAPIQSASLEAVHDALCGHLEGDWWRESFYEMSGLEKLVRCELILADPADVESRALLALANRADVIALGNLTRKLMELPVSKQRRPTTAVDDLEY